MAPTLTLLACGGASHHDVERSRQNGAGGNRPVDDEQPSGAAGMPQAVDEPGDTLLSLCEGNELGFGPLPDGARFALDGGSGRSNALSRARSGERDDLRA